MKTRMDNSWSAESYPIEGAPIHQQVGAANWNTGKLVVCAGAGLTEVAR